MRGGDVTHAAYTMHVPERCLPRAPCDLTAVSTNLFHRGKGYDPTRGQILQPDLELDRQSIQVPIDIAQHTEAGLAHVKVKPFNSPQGLR